jgi:hypothetical protein
VIPRSDGILKNYEGRINPNLGFKMQEYIANRARLGIGRHSIRNYLIASIISPRNCNIPDGNKLTVNDSNHIANTTDETLTTITIMLCPFFIDRICARRKTTKISFPQFILVKINTEEVMLLHGVKLSLNSELELFEVHYVSHIKIE